MTKYIVLGCGSNGGYQLGLNHCEDTNSFQESLFEDVEALRCKPVQIACGGNHTLILTENGNVYVAGSNDQGQCGLPLTESALPKFRELKHPSGNRSIRWRHVSAGWEFSVLCDSLNCFYTCGTGLKGELGLGSEIKSTGIYERPVKIDYWDPGNRDIVALRSSISATICQLSTGEFWGWGNGRKGQLGKCEDPKGVINTPQKLDFGDSIKELKNVHFSMARDFTVFGDSNTGQIIFAGRGIDRLNIPSQLKTDPFESLNCGWSFVQVKFPGSRLLSLGNNRHGQLGLADEKGITDLSFLEDSKRSHSSTPNTPPSLQYFAVGSEHSLLYSTSSGTVYAWGWGEHGNCGIPSGNTSDSLVFKKPNAIGSVRDLFAFRNWPEEVEVVGLFGGCATSWLVCCVKED